MVGKVTSSQKPSASVLPAIMGYSPYQTPLVVLDRAIKCVEQGVHSLPDTEPPPEPATWGNLLEDTILEMAADRLGVGNLIMDHPEPHHYQDILSCSLDGTAEGGGLVVSNDPSRGIYVMSDDDEIELVGMGILEAKLTRVAAQETPDPYRGPIQLQGQMLCTGAQWGVIAILYQGVELYIYVYKADVEMQQKIVMACSDFERRVRDEDWYPAMSATEAADMKGDAPDDVEMDADEALKEKVERLAHIRTELKAYEALASDLQLDIMNAMGEANICNAGQYKITWPVRRVKAKPAQVKEIAAVEEHWARAKTLKLEEL